MFSDEVKYFFIKVCIKEDDVLAFLLLGYFFYHIFGPKKDKLFCVVFLFQRGMSNANCDFVLYLHSEGFNISWIYPGTILFQNLKTVFTIPYSTLSLVVSQFIFLKCDESIWDLVGSFRQKRICLFSLKQETMRNIHNRNVAELARYIIVLYTQDLGTCFVDTRILVLHVFSLGLLTPSFLRLI